MPVRSAYAGDAGVLGGDGYPLIPLQVETQAYFGRFTTAPSAAYKNALNRAIYRWKAIGAYSLLQDLYLFLADTQADSLRNLISAARDATLVGSPTFTANKGFSGIVSTTTGISMPYSTSGLGTNNQGYVFAGRYDLVAGVGVPYLGSAVNNGGCVSTLTGGIKFGPTSGAFQPYNSGSAGEFSACGHFGITPISPTGAVSSGGGAGGAVEASPMTTRSSSLLRLSAWGVFSSGNPTTAVLIKFVSILNELCMELGANV